jgi:hypothetical protein
MTAMTIFMGFASPVSTGPQLPTGRSTRATRQGFGAPFVLLSLGYQAACQSSAATRAPASLGDIELKFIMKFGSQALLDAMSDLLSAHNCDGLHKICANCRRQCA